MIVVDLRKQQALDSDPKAIHQIIFTDRAENIRIYCNNLLYCNLSILM